MTAAGPSDKPNGFENQPVHIQVIAIQQASTDNQMPDRLIYI